MNKKPNNPIPALIVDDEPMGRAFLKRLIQKHCPEIQVLDEADSLEQAKIALQNPEIKLVFLDIYLPDGDGFRLLEAFPNRNFEVIFTTAHDQHSLEAFEVQALQYLLKPIDAEILIQTVQHFSRLFQQSQTELTTNPERLAITSKEEIIFINPQDIIRCEADGNYTHLYLTEKRHLLSSKTLSYFEKRLPMQQFFRAHDKHLVNLQKVEKFIRSQGGQLLLHEEHLVSVSMRKRDALLEMLLG